jgi:translation initiation factor 3 subunit A
MSYHSYKKPENALRRAQELYRAGKKQLSLEIVNAVLGQRRHKQWTATHEDLIKIYLKITVDLRNKLVAKDGLYLYRSLCQREAPGSLEVVVNFLIEYAEKKCEEAIAVAGDKVKINELTADDGQNAAENIILTSVNSHGTSRADKELVIPWIKFLWEAYRSVLEVTKNNNRLIDVYQQTCLKAYKFCQKYGRTLEFRKLNDMIKKHLQDSIKYYEKDRDAGKKQSLIELDADYFELHLETRFTGLQTATEMKQWNQAYHIVDEIYSIMQKIDRSIKPEMMAAYYKSLSDMFLVSKSYLFHAYAWLKYYHLNEKNNEKIQAKELTRMASALTLSALAVPVVKRYESISSYANDEADKKKRMAALLGYTFNPNRETLIEQITSMGLLEQCEPWVQELFSLLEKEFRPHDLVTTVVKHLDHMRENSDAYGEYCYGIEELLIIRLCQQLSKVSIYIFFELSFSLLNSVFVQEAY